MTFSTQPYSYPLNIIAFHTPAVEVAYGGSTQTVIKPQQQQVMAGSPQSTINTTTGVITLPNRPCLITGSMMYMDYNNEKWCEVQWWDNTNTQWIGSIGLLPGNDWQRYNDNFANPLATDEQAISLEQNIQVSLRVKERYSANNGMTIDGYHASYSIHGGKTRILIYEF